MISKTKTLAIEREKINRGTFIFQKSIRVFYQGLNNIVHLIVPENLPKCSIPAIHQISYQVIPYHQTPPAGSQAASSSGQPSQPQQ
ncbi:MAG: hypothetical protein R2758_04140 [Bacteroidales bacterium]